MRNNTPADFATMYWQLALASTETIAWRWWMMATGSCSPSEYELMVAEKVKASLEMGAIMAAPRPTVSKLMGPWSRGARRNAKRLRGKR
jgi:hypothetical protein